MLPKKPFVYNYIDSCISKQGFVLMGLIDPDKKDMKDVKKIVEEMEKGGADLILLGGSTGAEGESISECAQVIKNVTKIPLLLFPGNPGGITKYADATYFLDIINAGDIYWGSQYRILMAPIIKKADIEAIPTSYILIEPGETVGWVTNAKLIPRNKKELGGICALAGQFSGSKIILVDCGSGNPMGPPLQIINHISKSISGHLIYAGGINSREYAQNVIKAGARGIHVGNISENCSNISEKFRTLKLSMSEGVKQRGTLHDEYYSS